MPGRKSGGSCHSEQSENLEALCPIYRLRPFTSLRMTILKPMNPGSILPCLAAAPGQTGFEDDKKNCNFIFLLSTKNHKPKTKY